MAAVEQLLGVKGRAVHAISRTATVFEAVAKMEANNVGALLVMDGGRPCGMITERDYLRRVALQGRSSKTTFVQEIMSSNLICVNSQTDVESCMGLMTERRIRHLPVMDGPLLTGLISIGDVVKYLVQEREATIVELNRYIQGEYARAQVPFS